VRHLGFDEHRFRSAQVVRPQIGTRDRHEPWMSAIVDLATCRVLGVVGGRGSAGVGAWI